MNGSELEGGSDEWPLILIKYDQPYQRTTYYLIKMQGNKKGQSVKVDKKQANILKEKVKEFDSIFQEQQAQFQQSLDETYYIVSTKYIEEWREFCHSNEVERPEPQPMNQDLMDQAGGQLRPGLSESQDFEIVNEKIFSILKSEHGFEIKRQAHMLGN